MAYLPGQPTGFESFSATSKVEGQDSIGVPSAGEDGSLIYRPKDAADGDIAFTGGGLCLFRPDGKTTDGAGTQFLFGNFTGPEPNWLSSHAPLGLDAANNAHWWWSQSEAVRVEWENDVGEMQVYAEGGPGNNAWYGVQEGAFHAWSFGHSAGAQSFQLCSGFGLTTPSAAIQIANETKRIILENSAPDQLTSRTGVGFYQQPSPYEQPDSIADPTDLPTALTSITAILDVMRACGQIKQPSETVGFFDGSAYVDCGTLYPWLIFEQTDKITATFMYKGTGDGMFFAKMKNDTTFRGWGAQCSGGEITFTIRSDQNTGNLIQVRSTSTLINDDVAHKIMVHYNGDQTAANCVIEIDDIPQALTILSDNLDGPINDGTGLRLGSRENLGSPLTGKLWNFQLNNASKGLIKVNNRFDVLDSFVNSLVQQNNGVTFVAE